MTISTLGMGYLLENCQNHVKRRFHSRWMLLILLLTSALAPSGAPALRPADRLHPGSDCFVQNYVDHDASSAYRDYACGERTYDGHDGTDFRLRSLVAQRAGVTVLAAADGVVAGVRDGMEDVRSGHRQRRREGARVWQWPGAAPRRRLGNPVLPHGARQPGRDAGPARDDGAGFGPGRPVGPDRVPAPAFHRSTPRKIVDPFAPEPKTGQCGSDATVWVAATATQLAYRRRVMLNAGFSDRVLSMDEVENHEPERMNLSPESPALVVFVKMIGLETATLRRSDCARRRRRAGGTTAEAAGTRTGPDPGPDRTQASRRRLAGRPLSRRIPCFKRWQDGLRRKHPAAPGPVPRAAPGRGPWNPRMRAGSAETGWPRC